MTIIRKKLVPNPKGAYKTFELMKLSYEFLKAKEESAWKIAEMIVRDVTSLTLGTSSDLPSW